jgi:hypothetical protein
MSVVCQPINPSASAAIDLIQLSVVEIPKQANEMEVHSRSLADKDLSTEGTHRLLYHPEPKKKGPPKAKPAPTPTSINWKPASTREALKEITKLVARHITPGTTECAEFIEMLTAYLTHNHADAISGEEVFISEAADVQMEFNAAVAIKISVANAFNAILDQHKGVRREAALQELLGLVTNEIEREDLKLAA